MLAALLLGQVQQDPLEDGTPAVTQDLRYAPDVDTRGDELLRSVPHCIDEEIGWIVSVVLVVRLDRRARNRVGVLVQFIRVARWLKDVAQHGKGTGAAVLQEHGNPLPHELFVLVFVDAWGDAGGQVDGHQLCRQRRDFAVLSAPRFLARCRRKARIRGGRLAHQTPPVGVRHCPQLQQGLGQSHGGTDLPGLGQPPHDRAECLRNRHVDTTAFGASGAILAR